VGGLDHVVKTGTIIDAVDNQPWSGEANVHVSIANWVKTKEPRLLPERRRLWFKINSAAKKKPRKPGSGSAAKEYELDVRETGYINSALSDETDVSFARRLKCNTHPQRVFQGQVPGHDEFVLSKTEARELIAAEKRNREVIHPFLIGRDLVSGDGRPTRFVIDFNDMDILTASSYGMPFARLEANVLPDRKRKAIEGATQDGTLRPHHQLFLRRWWRQSYDRPEMIQLVKQIARFITCSCVTKRPVFCFVDHEIRPDHSLIVFTFADDYSFGILQSGTHWLWFITKCSKLKSDFRYTPPSVFDTFPWPQSPTPARIDAVAEAGRAGAASARRGATENLARAEGRVSHIGVAGKKPAQGRARRPGRRGAGGVRVLGAKRPVGPAIGAQSRSRRADRCRPDGYGPGCSRHVSTPRAAGDARLHCGEMMSDCAGPREAGPRASWHTRPTRSRPTRAWAWHPAFVVPSCRCGRVSCQLPRRHGDTTKSAFGASPLPRPSTTTMLRTVPGEGGRRKLTSCRDFSAGRRGRRAARGDGRSCRRRRAHRTEWV
jgi:hypothetical protein